MANGSVPLVEMCAVALFPDHTAAAALSTASARPVVEAEVDEFRAGTSVCFAPKSVAFLPPQVESFCAILLCAQYRSKCRIQSQDAQAGLLD